MVIFIYTVHPYLQLKRSDMQSLSIRESLRWKVGFFKTKFRVWLVPFALSVVILAFAINLYGEGAAFITSIRDFYPLFMLYLIAFLLMCFSARFSCATYLKSYTIYLDDLSTGKLTDVRKATRKYRVKVKFIVLGIAILILIGMLVFIMMAG
jgi:hypothetical protein